ncbi:MAG TPA: serine/threonine-protein kinase [Kofleriaceae bacterium]
MSVDRDRMDRTGQLIGGRFRIEAPIGTGAMAKVFRATDAQTGDSVAVKILRSSLGGDPSAKERFKREGDVQQRMRHRNIAALLGSGVTEYEEPYLVVELLRGKTLRGVLKEEKRVAPRRAASYAWQALQGLTAVHAAGVLHRDLKPANIMLEPSPGPVERVVLIDFGFATFEGSARLTAQGTVVGSLRYMAPERLRGEPVDPRSDVYAIGVMLYEMLVGEPPFGGADDFSLIDAHLNHDPPPLDASLPQTFDAIILRAMAKDQSDRYADAAEMAKALEAASMALTE